MLDMPKRDGPLKIRSILVIDDHPLYCDALSSTLSALFHTSAVRSVLSLREAMAALDAGLQPDLVLLDLKLPDVVGLTGFYNLKERLSDVPFLVISADVCDSTIQTLMEAGAAGFIPKDASRSVIATALQRVQNGDKFLPAGYCPQKRAAPKDGVDADEIARRIGELTPQQARIMGLICAGMPNKLIAYELSLAEATVKAHITALLRRLGVRNRTQAAVLVNSASLERNIRMPEAEPRALTG
ncbi:response regulator [Oceaniglobus roseus]|uniref:response regulator n=1 Tax=Oceaniglobus roseus TaxID=1737570 RepID=UPI001C12A93D|nr:response regulator transcription factor [Kandeliimicrobium roseum]